jgi:CP family cyanate transporter-like MFS transporter
MKRPLIDPALLVILAGVCAALHVGKLPPALPALRDALGVTLLQAGFLLSMVQLAGMTLGLAVGLTADSFGLRRSMLLGLGTLAVASAVGGWARARTTCWCCGRSRASGCCWPRCQPPA